MDSLKGYITTPDDVATVLTYPVHQSGATTMQTLPDLSSLLFYMGNILPVPTACQREGSFNEADMMDYEPAPITPQAPSNLREAVMQGNHEYAHSFILAGEPITQDLFAIIASKIKPESEYNVSMMLRAIGSGIAELTQR